MYKVIESNNVQNYINTDVNSAIQAGLFYLFVFLIQFKAK